MAIGNKEVIRHAYENVLTASARLAAFATCLPTSAAEGLVNDRQTLLATNDLVIFAINARRLMDSTNTLSIYNKKTIKVFSSDDESQLTDTAITKIINFIVHHKELKIWRFKRELLNLHEGTSFDAYQRVVKAGNASFAPIVIVENDRQKRIITQISQLIDLFEQAVLEPIVDLCADERLYLDEENFTRG